MNKKKLTFCLRPIKFTAKRRQPETRKYIIRLQKHILEESAKVIQADVQNHVLMAEEHYSLFMFIRNRT